MSIVFVRFHNRLNQIVMFNIIVLPYDTELFPLYWYKDLGLEETSLLRCSVPPVECILSRKISVPPYGWHLNFVPQQLMFKVRALEEKMFKGSEDRGAALCNPDALRLSKHFVGQLYK
ncbi:hypothetical protein PROFUN_11346 [Planoprotostelium fungivorum]|uniref:Uncharacterized protein n=1 Tax=Planoprotostelium fungivorum TaxID=1890364 RepID=A0A2P6NAB9_9EUKA|nr:hypothetical protein PROFUN_11346 [Planoprotostelium fungivorum]